jgi:hypothetical protein
MACDVELSCVFCEFPIPARPAIDQDSIRIPEAGAAGRLVPGSRPAGRREETRTVQIPTGRDGGGEQSAAKKTSEEGDALTIEG